MRGLNTSNHASEKRKSYTGLPTVRFYLAVGDLNLVSWPDLKDSAAFRLFSQYSRCSEKVKLTRLYGTQ